MVFVYGITVRGKAMADLADMAQQDMEAMASLVQRIRHDYSASSFTECEECGNDIPEGRRKLGGVRLCIECQRVVEIAHGR